MTAVACLQFPTTTALKKCIHRLIQRNLNMDEDWTNEVQGAVAAPKIAELPEIKLFSRWNCDDVQVSDMSLQGSSNSYAIKKKDELERVAKSNR
ncbi:hypothetical protein JTB14_019263 [Gonioctena quinquepunctata]|nr:hypothetical protein JTB14_019263 [Gonioctena quinquepunctata]